MFSFLYLGNFCTEWEMLINNRVKAILDANRNSLMLLELKFSIGTLGLAAGTLCSALYGMNLKNYIEESDLGFAVVSGICFVTTAIVCAYGLVKLRRVQRVRMWGEGGIQDRYSTRLANHSPGIPSRGGTANWRSDSLDPIWSGLPGEGRAERLRRIRSRLSSQAPAPTALPPSKKPNGRSNNTNRLPREGGVKHESQEQQQRGKQAKNPSPDPGQCTRGSGPASSCEGEGEAAVADAGLGSAR